MDLSVIIVSFNTKALLRDSIKSICDTINSLSYEIIVIDNASDDGSREMIEAEFDKVILIRNVHNAGFASANNQGIRRAKGKYFLLLNSDALLNEGSVERLVEFADTHPNAAAIGPRVLNFDGTLQSKGFHFPSILFALMILFRLPKFFQKEKLPSWFPGYYWDENTAGKVDWISGCCILLRREAVEDIGGLCEDFFMYHEDEEWCYRAGRKGYEIWYCPVAEVSHLNMASPLLNRSEIGRQSTKIFYKKTIGICRGAAISFLYILSNTVKILRVILMTREANEYQDTKDRLKNELKFLKFLIT